VSKISFTFALQVNVPFPLSVRAGFVVALTTFISVGSMRNVPASPSSALAFTAPSIIIFFIVDTSINPPFEFSPIPLASNSDVEERMVA